MDADQSKPEKLGPPPKEMRTCESCGRKRLKKRKLVRTSDGIVIVLCIACFKRAIDFEKKIVKGGN